MRSSTASASSIRRRYDGAVTVAGQLAETVGGQRVVGPAEEEFHAAVVQQRAHVCGGQAGSDRDRDQPGPEGSQVADHVLDRVGPGETDALAGDDPEICEPRRHRVHLDLELDPAEAAALRIRLDDRLRVPALLGVALHELSEIGHRLGGHAPSVPQLRGRCSVLRLW